VTAAGGVSVESFVGADVTAFKLTFSQWPPTSAPPRHGIESPIGTIRIGRSGKSTHREIKVRMGGPASGRWMNLARFWWLKNRGPVPDGMRVGHYDGDPMNDDPSNYALFSPGDVIASYHLDNPKWSAAQHRRCGDAAGRHNRERAAIERNRRTLAWRWYPVDFARRLIFNDPKRKQWQVFAAHGGAMESGSANGAGYIAPALGWPGVTSFGAACLAVLVEGERTTGKLWREATDLLGRLRSRSPRSRASLHGELVRLRDAGLVTSRRRGRLPGIHQITDAAVGSRGPVCPVVAVWGEDLDGEEFQGFRRVTADGEEVCADAPEADAMDRENAELEEVA
jgi:hypothetical protein